MARGPETYKKLAPGVYAVFHGRKKVGVRALVRVKGKLYSHRWKSPDTTIRLAKAWQEDTRADVRSRPQTPKAHEPEGFAADAARYLKAVAAMTSYRDRERDINQWVAAFGSRDRASITSAEIAEQLAAWKNAKLAASTVNHRRTALLHLWRVLDGKGAANPVKDIPKYREPAAEARGLDYRVVRAIFAAMPDTVTRARLEVLAYTGLPYSLIGRLELKDIDLERGILVRPERRKGRGTRRQAVPLTSDAKRALVRLVALDGLKPFSHSSAYKSFRLACDKVQAQFHIDLTGVRPYDLRHSYGTEVYRLTGDERAVQMLLGHAKIETTHRYTLGGVDARLVAAVAAFDGEKAPPDSLPPRKR